MRYLIVCLTVLYAFSACKKEVATPQVPVPIPNMQYSDFNNTIVKFGQNFKMDLDNDGANDFYFSSQLVGDPLEQKDKKQFFIGSSLYAFCPVNNINGLDRFPMVIKGDNIGYDCYPRYEWSDALGVVLVQKTITFYRVPYWEGDWKNASHRYLPLFVIKDNAKFFGWLEISFDILNEGMLIHKAGISKEADKEVRAGM